MTDKKTTDRRPTSWNAADADRARLRRLQGKFLSQGLYANHSQLISLALCALDDAGDEQRAALYAREIGE